MLKVTLHLLTSVFTSNVCILYTCSFCSAFSTKAILSRKMILAGLEEHVKIRCPVKLQLCVSKVCSDCGSQ